jgi:hypothetical protein
VEGSQAQSQVDSATKATWARCSMFDEEIELEGREDYEADYEKVLDGLEYPIPYSNRDRTDARIHPVLRGLMLENPMSRHEFSFLGSHLLSFPT